MLDEVATAVATGAAGNVVAYMASGHIDALRVRIAKILHRESGDGHARVLRAVEDDSVALAQGAVSEADVKARWSAVLAAVLAADPGLLPEVAALAAEPAPGLAINIGSQHNYGSGTFVGGNFYAGGQTKSVGSA
jgi:hypothetical protein